VRCYKTFGTLRTYNQLIINAVFGLPDIAAVTPWWHYTEHVETLY